MSRLFQNVCVAALLVAGAPVMAQDVTIEGRAIIPENLTSTADGTLYIGSYGAGGIYRAAPGARTASRWLAPGAGSVNRVMGLWADEARGQLWACDTSAKVDDRTDSSASTGSVKQLELATGKLIASYPMEGGGACNDLTLARDGTLYITDMAGRILRIRPGDKAMTTWSRSPLLESADGLAVLDDGRLYVNSFRSGKLLRIAINADGSAGAVTELKTARPLEQPDGMRPSGPTRILLSEAAGKLSELPIAGDTVQVRTVKDDVADPAGVTLAGNTAYVSSAGWQTLRDPAADKGVFTIFAIPYSPAD